MCCALLIIQMMFKKKYSSAESKERSILWEGRAEEMAAVLHVIDTHAHLYFTHKTNNLTTSPINPKKKWWRKFCLYGLVNQRNPKTIDMLLRKTRIRRNLFNKIRRYKSRRVLKYVVFRKFFEDVQRLSRQRQASRRMRWTLNTCC